MSDYCNVRGCNHYALDLLGLVVCGHHATKDAWIQIACDAMRRLESLRRRVAALELESDEAKLTKKGSA